MVENTPLWWLVKREIGQGISRMDFNLAYIPERFNFPLREEFDPEYMRKLFETGHNLVGQCYLWKESSPDFFEYLLTVFAEDIFL